MATTDETTEPAETGLLVLNEEQRDFLISCIHVADNYGHINDSAFVRLFDKIGNDLKDELYGVEFAPAPPASLASHSILGRPGEAPAMTSAELAEFEAEMASLPPREN